MGKRVRKLTRRNSKISRKSKVSRKNKSIKKRRVNRKTLRRYKLRGGNVGKVIIYNLSDPDYDFLDVSKDVSKDDKHDTIYSKNGEIVTLVDDRHWRGGNSDTFLWTFFGPDGNIYNLLHYHIFTPQDATNIIEHLNSIEFTRTMFFMTAEQELAAAKEYVDGVIAAGVAGATSVDTHPLRVSQAD